MQPSKLITVFTPTFNRCDLLPRLFDSLEKQTFKNFEWLIVDDGSTDASEAVISEMKARTSDFSINYIKQENQGKHIAVNTGLKHALGDYFFIVDSDDRLPENSLEIVAEKISEIDADPKIAGVVGKAYYFDGTPVGMDNLSEDIVCSVFDYRYKHGQQGDYENIIKTAVFKQFPFPKYLNEKFIAESIVWHRMGQQFDWYFFSENVYECEYQDDGLSARSVNYRRKYPLGAMHIYAELGQIKRVPLKHRIRSYFNFWRFFFARRLSTEEKSLVPKVPWYAFIFIPFGIGLSFLDSLKA